MSESKAIKEVSATMAIMDKFKFQDCFECEIEVTEEDGGFVARCLDPDVASDGNTEAAALANLRQALELYYEASTAATLSAVTNPMIS